MRVSTSPHIRDSLTTRKIMIYVIIALMPATFGGIYFFGIRALYLILISVITAILVEIAVQKATDRHIKITGSSIVTGLLLGLILPSEVPLWLPVIGSIVAVLIAKHAFGPHNAIFNPALIGFVFLKISWPALTNVYKIPDAITSATPLSIAKQEGFNAIAASYGGKIALYNHMFFGNIGGAIGETSALLLLLGALFLFIKRIITWHIPFTYLGTVIILAAILQQDIIFHLLAGGLMIGAFFMATDYVTTPITKKGRIIFGIGCGILTIVIRLYSGFPEGVAYSILLMNAATPLLDRITRPKPFGK